MSTTGGNKFAVETAESVEVFSDCDDDGTCLVVKLEAGGVHRV